MAQRQDLNRQIANTQDQLDRLLNLRLHDEVDAETFRSKADELRA
ncbi:MAG: hypothetical protein AAGL66_03695 [Pseudomonadota bacterium]